MRKLWLQLKQFAQGRMTSEKASPGFPHRYLSCATEKSKVTSLEMFTLIPSS